MYSICIPYFLYFWIQIKQKGDPNVMNKFPIIKVIARIFEIGNRIAEQIINIKKLKIKCASFDLRYT